MLCMLGEDVSCYYVFPFNIYVLLCKVNKCIRDSIKLHDTFFNYYIAVVLIIMASRDRRVSLPYVFSAISKNLPESRHLIFVP